MYSTEFVRKRGRKEKSHRLLLGKKQKNEKICRSGNSETRENDRERKERQIRTDSIVHTVICVYIDFMVGIITL